MKSTLLRLALVALSTPVISHAQAAPTAPATAVEKEQGAALTLPSFEVRSDKDEGYLSTQTTSGSRTVEMLRDVPATISVMNRQLMEDLNITTVDELSEYAVTGHISDDTQGTNAIYIFRGMNTDARLLNGVKSYDSRTPMRWSASRPCVVRVRSSTAKRRRAAR